MTLPLSFTILAARNTSIPAPEPKSTTVSPSSISANLIGFPQPTPSTEDSGISFNLSESYPTAFDDSNGVKRISLDVPQQSLEGIQHELELPSKAIFPY